MSGDEQQPDLPATETTETPPVEVTPPATAEPEVSAAPEELAAVGEAPAGVPSPPVEEPAAVAPATEDPAEFPAPPAEPEPEPPAETPAAAIEETAEPEPAPEPSAAESAPTPAAEAPAEPTPEAAEAPAPAVATEPAPAEPAAAPGTAATPEIGSSAPAGSPPPTGAPKRSESGQIIEVRVMAVDAEEVEVELPDGRRGVISRRHLTSDGRDASEVVSVGDTVTAAVLIREDHRQRVALSRVWALKQTAWTDVVKAMEDHSIVTGTVRQVSTSGLVLDVGGVRGFVPTSQIGPMVEGDDITTWVGKNLDTTVIEADPDKERLVLSRRSVLNRQRRKGEHDLLAGLEVGSVHTGKVSSLVDYGAFIDIGGIAGLVHVSEMSWDRVRRPSDVVSVGDEVQVRVMDVKIKRRRIKLSMRALGEDPLRQIEVGAVVQGEVSRLVDFGAFVRIDPGIEGLVHITELAEYRVSVPEEVVTPGETVSVKIIGVDKKRRRVELSINQAMLLPPS
ncbi:MAG: S1 RNA-binding domain-containing protein [Actinomycetia bacterium]|nr:S1 RNA-binding domain-containing protein [Actinomycetes bacterium]